MPTGKQQFTNNAGVPLAGGKVYTFEAGTTTPKATYQDAAGTVESSNPIVLNARGEALAFWRGAYDVKVTDANGLTIYTVGNYQAPVMPDDLSADDGTEQIAGTWFAGAKAKLSDLAAQGGAALMGFVQTGIGAAGRSVQDKLRDSVSICDFGAKGNGNDDDSDAVQAALTALAPGGELIVPAGKFVLTKDIRITKPISIRGIGPGSYANDLGSYFIQKTPGKNAFTLVAANANYAFEQAGIIDVHFKDLSIIGPGDGSRALAGIGVDTTVNSGDFHIRGLSFTNVRLRYFKKAMALTGIAYLNNWFGGGISNCDDGIVFARGSSSDVGGQNRFFGFTAVAIAGACISYFEDTVGGSVGLHGCTLSESSRGFSGNREVKFYSSPDCEFEANSVAGVYFSITGDNPNTSAPKTVCGKFLTNAVDIWVDKTTTAYGDGGFYWPMRIDEVYLGSAVGLKVTVPPGHFGIDSPAFILGRNIAGPSNGQVLDSQLSPNFMGTDERKRRVTWRYPFSGSTASGAVLDSLPPGMVMLSVRAYLTVNASSYTALQIGDQSNGSRYLSFDASAQPLNTWVTWSPSIPQLVINGSNNHLLIAGTAGIKGAAGMIEVDGYIQ